MREQTEFDGYFYRADFPNNRVLGSLRFGDNGQPILTLAEEFVQVNYDDELFANGTHPSLEPPVLIIGFSNPPERHVTLYRCSNLPTSYFSTKMRPIPIFPKYTAQIVFHDAVFTKEEDVRFKELSVHYSYLDEWLDIWSLNMTPAFDYLAADEMTLTYKRPESIHALTTADYSLYFDVSASVNSRWATTGSGVPKEASITQTSFVLIVFREASTLDNCFVVLEKVRHFLSVATLRPVYTLTTQGKPAGNPFRLPVPIYRQQDEMVERRDSMTPMFAELEMLFTFHTAEQHIETSLRNWIEKAELLEPITDLYLGTFYNPKLYPYNRFLNLAHAVETYHRLTNGSRDLSKADHKQRIKEIVAAVPESYKEWVKEKLAPINEPSLKMRMVALFDKSHTVLEKLIPDRDDFISWFVDTRNYYTHYDPRLRERAARGKNLSKMSDRLQYIVEICLLHELGFTNEEIDERMTNNIRYLSSEERKQWMTQQGNEPSEPYIYRFEEH